MENIIRITEPARDWAEGLLLGNGHMGGVIYGGYDREVIDLSEITFYSGEASSHNNQENAKEQFREMGRLVKVCDYKKSMETAKKFIGNRHNYGTNLSVGRIVIELEEGEVLGYERKLDLTNGIAEITYTKDKNQITRETFISHPSKKLFYKMESQTPGSIQAKIYYEGISGNYTTESQEDEYRFHVKAIESLHSDGKTGVSLLGKLGIWHKGGKVSYTEDGIYITRADSIVMTVALYTDFEKGFLPDISWDVSEKPDYDKEKELHIRDFSGFMKRVEINLLEDAKTQLMFQYGRYLLLSSSREDSPLPAHLQGVWNDNVASRIGWTCDMHLDINTQMNYWIGGAANLTESILPLFRWLEERVIPSGRLSASKSYGLKGWSADLVSNAWGYSAPYWSPTISPCPTGGIWAACAYWDYYQHTGEKNFLRERAYPVLNEAAEFFVDYVFIDHKTGYYTSGPSISPENAFLVEGEKYYFSIGTTFEITLIRELFTCLSLSAEILGIDNELIQRVKEILPRLLPFRILEDKTLGEWSHDYLAADSQHRHTSHLLGLYPFSQITTEKTPELAAAVRNSIKEKLNLYENWEDTGWARALLLLYSARLKDGEEAYFHLKAMQEKLTHTNYLVMHPPTRGAGSFKEVYELDGNTGFTMGVLEMLLQSYDGVIRLLPALPKAWSKGSISGLLTKEGVNVSFIWENYRIIEATFLGKETKEIVVEYPVEQNVRREETISLMANVPAIV